MRAVAWGLALAFTLAACGGNSSETTITGGGTAGGSGATSIALDVPTGPNTTEIVVDPGPGSGFSLGAANIPYVTITVCTPGSTTACVTIDHVFLDTGSIGLRVLKSALRGVTLPALNVPQDIAHATPAGPAFECYPFVLGAVWGGLATADVAIASELAPAIPVQVIDDGSSPAVTAPADCIAAANGQLQNSVSALQANGILGIGMVAYDCGLPCSTAAYAGGYTLYYSCSPATGCVPAAIPIALQMQNPIAHFAVNNNGSVVHLPALPDLGAGVVKGRLVFGIGTQTNNQIPPSATMVFVDPDPASANYLYFATASGGTSYPQSYVDSGTNAFFFDDTSISRQCQSSTGTLSGWYCPATKLQRAATITDVHGGSVAVNFGVANADALFSTSSVAFANLAGSTGGASASFTWGLPFFYGRPVFTSIWGQSLSPNGPWNAF
jgi:hypothetical protein